MIFDSRFYRELYSTGPPKSRG